MIMYLRLFYGVCMAIVLQSCSSETALPAPTLTVAFDSNNITKTNKQQDSSLLKSLKGEILLSLLDTGAACTKQVLKSRIFFDSLIANKTAYEKMLLGERMVMYTYIKTTTFEDSNVYKNGFMVYSGDSSQEVMLTYFPTQDDNKYAVVIRERLGEFRTLGYYEGTSFWYWNRINKEWKPCESCFPKIEPFSFFRGTPPFKFEKKLKETGFYEAIKQEAESAHKINLHHSKYVNVNMNCENIQKDKEYDAIKLYHLPLYVLYDVKGDDCVFLWHDMSGEKKEYDLLALIYKWDKQKEKFVFLKYEKVE